MWWRQCIWYKHKLVTCWTGDGRISQSSDRSTWCWRWRIPLRGKGGDGERCMESCMANSTSWSSFRHSHSPSTETRKLHKYMVSCAPAMSCSIMMPPWWWSPGGQSFKPDWDSCRIENLGLFYLKNLRYCDRSATGCHSPRKSQLLY